MRLPISANPPGSSLSRYVMALIVTSNANAAAEYARKIPEWKTTPGTLMALDAAASSQSLSGDSAIAQYGISAEFFQLFQQQSLIGRLSSQMRRAPFRIKVPAEDSSGTNCSWVTESGLKPLVALCLQSLTLDEFKLSLIVAISKELARMSSPSAEQVVRQILVANVARFIDSEFLSSNAAVPGTSPAGIAWNQQSQVSSGGTVAQISADVSAMGGKLGSWAKPCWITRPQTFQYLAALNMVQFAAGQAMFSGFPIFWSEGSPAQLLLIDLNAVLFADDGRSDIYLAEAATVTMDNGVSPATTTTVSLWQNNLVALRVERFVSWLCGHNAVAVAMPVVF